MDDQNEVLALPDGFEACHLATKLTNKACSLLTTGWSKDKTLDGQLDICLIHPGGAEEMMHADFLGDSNEKIISSLLKTQSLLEEIEPGGDRIREDNGLS